jgi:hypothetical protein
MRPAPSLRIDSRAIRLWQVHGLIQTAVMGAMGMSTATVAIPVADLSPWVALLMLPLVATYCVAVVFVFPRVRWRLWRYQLGANELDLQHGMLVVRRTLVPLVRVQHVDTVQGPLAKLFGLSAVTVSTAASTHEIPALSDETADQLRDSISALAREARDQL